MKRTTLLALALSTTFLAACGGGGGDAPASPAVATFPLDAVATKVATTGVSLTGTAIDGADTWTMSLSMAPATDQIFEGILSKKASVSVTLKINGVVGAVDTSSAYFSINPFTSKGALMSDGSYTVYASGNGVLPIAAKVGEAGSLGTATTYTNSSKTNVKETMQLTWTVEADTATTAFSCTNIVTKNTGGTQISTVAGCYKIDTNGNILGMRFTLSVAGKTLVFK